MTPRLETIASVLAAALLLAMLVLVCALASACASMRQTCRYESGALVEQTTRTVVLGTGETELTTTACAALSYSTQDTGLSKNGKDALGVVAEGAARGALGAVVPSPSRVLR